MLSSRNYEGVLEVASKQNTLLNSNKGALGLRRAGIVGEMDKVQAHDEDTIGSGSGSGLSDLSALENETDDFGRLILQHRRDARRMNHATRGDQRAFRKARPNPRIADRLTREERARLQTDGEHHERTSSRGSNDAEPPLNVPREWGRHARKQSDWLKKLKAPSQNGDDHSRNRMNTDIHMEELVEMTPPSMRRGHLSATPPSSLRHMNTTLRPFAESKDQDMDFTSNSFITSTPARPKYHRKIDDLARREIEVLEYKAVTTRTLDQIDQKSPNAVLRRSSSQRLRERAEADGLLSPSMSPPMPPTNPESPSRIPVRKLYGSGNKENLPVRDEAVAGSKASHIPTFVNRATQPLSSKQLPRPAHQRNDSMSLLRKLARVSSMSPSPEKDHANHNMENDAEPVAEHRILSRGKVDVDTDTNPYDADQFVPPRHSPAVAKTPIVTGAWVDRTVRNDRPTAPASTATIHETEVPQSDQRHVKMESGSARPTSALDEIVREAKVNASAQNLGESTLQSLEDIVRPNVDVTDASIPEADKKADAPQTKATDEGVESTQAGKDRRQEQLAMEAMNKHLRTARTSIKDANRGLRRVENKIETVQEPKAAVVPTVVELQPYGHVHCESCGGSAYQSVWKALWIEYRSCYYIWDSNARYGIRFTWLGLACLLWWMWFLSEWSLCTIYCNPRYSSGRGYYIVWGAPKFPFVIPTLLFRPIRRFLGEDVCNMLLNSVSDAVGVAFHALFGDSSASAKPPPVVIKPRLREPIKKAFVQTTRAQSDLFATATAAAARVAYSIVDAVDEAGSMWDDALIP